MTIESQNVVETSPPSAPAGRWDIARIAGALVLALSTVALVVAVPDPNVSLKLVALGGLAGAVALTLI